MYTCSHHRMAPVQRPHHTPPISVAVHLDGETARTLQQLTCLRREKPLLTSTQRQKCSSHDSINICPSLPGAHPFQRMTVCGLCVSHLSSLSHLLHILPVFFFFWKAESFDDEIPGCIDILSRPHTQVWWPVCSMLNLLPDF